MHGTTKALIVAAAALQAGANPVRLFERQASSTTLAPSSLASATSSFVPATTYSEPVPTPLPTEIPSPFPFPGSNGTYYICSFPPTSNGTASSPVPTSSAPSTVTASLPIATDDVSSLLPSVTSSILSSTSASTITGRPKPPIPTEFTVVGPSTTAVIECIQVPQPHSPAENSTTSLPLPASTSSLPSVVTTPAPDTTGTAI